jgi:group I intron endonuclease
VNTVPPSASNGKFPYPTPPAGMSGVYAIINTANKKRYIGSSQDIQLRWQQHRTHLRMNTHHSPYLQRAWNKYGEDAFIFEIIEYALPGLCIMREQYWMNKLKPAYNVYPQAGSRFGYKTSEETRIKLSEMRKGSKSPMEGKHHTEEAKEKMRKARLGKPGLKGIVRTEEQKTKQREKMLGRKLSEEHRQAISNGQKGRKMPAEAIEKTRQFHIGRKRPPQTVERNRLSHLGQPAWNKGQKASEEAKAKMREGWAKRRARLQAQEGKMDEKT